MHNNPKKGHPSSLRLRQDVGCCVLPLYWKELVLGVQYIARAAVGNILQISLGYILFFLYDLRRECYSRTKIRKSFCRNEV